MLIGHDRPTIIGGHNYGIGGRSKVGFDLDVPLNQLDGISFMSKDVHGHVCTVVGALWRLDGREFDGDDYIALPNNILVNATEWTFILWLNNALLGNRDSPIGGGLGVFNEIPSLRFDAATKYQVNALRAAELFVNNQSTSENATIDVWEQVSFLYDRLDCLFDRNGSLSDTLVALDDRDLDPTTINSRIGGGLTASLGFYLGIVGSVVISRAALYVPLKIQDYIANRWRYQ